MDDCCAGHVLVIRMPGILGICCLWMDNASVDRYHGRAPGADVSGRRI